MSWKFKATRRAILGCGRRALPGKPGPFHHPLRRRPEPELLVQRVCVLRVEDPAPLRVRAVVDHLAEELHAEAAATVLREHVDVAQIRDRRAVADGPGEADLAGAVVEPDDPRRLTHEALLLLPGPPGRPVGVVADEVVDGVHVDPVAVVVDLEAAG